MPQFEVHAPFAHGLPSADVVRSLLDYAPETGEFRWRERREDQFDPNATRSAEHACANWNARFAGKVAGGLRVDGYLCIQIGGRRYGAHRIAWLIMTGEWPEAEVDHINLNKSDNRWSNLRAATRAQNMANIRSYRSNTSGAKGVWWNKQCQKWQASITCSRGRRHLGLFCTIEEASDAYEAAALQYHGEFARLS